MSFDIRRGETVGIVGESGSGKSTVARCIARLIEPTSGRIVIGDTDFASISRAQLHALRRKVQIVFQDPYRSLNPRRTVGAAIVEGPMNYGASRGEAHGARAAADGARAARPQGRSTAIRTSSPAASGSASASRARWRWSPTC